MQERPIVFSGPVVRAILDGRKTQTRRIVKHEAVNIVHGMRKVKALDGYDAPSGTFRICSTYEHVTSKTVRCPYGMSGDRLWVRETWLDAWAQVLPATSVQYHYRADTGLEHSGYKWRPAIHMPREAARILLEVTEVRVERLQAISEEDAQAEGIEKSPHGNEAQWANYPLGSSASGWIDPKESFRSLWESINGPSSWNDNPWVWAITFRRIVPS